MHQAIYEFLPRVAVEQRTTTYGEIAPLAQLDMSRANDRNRIAEILDEISSHEQAAGRGLLSVVVVRGQGKSGGTPGQGFYALAKRLGVYSGVDAVSFFAQELGRVHSHWKPTGMAAAPMA